MGQYKAIVPPFGDEPQQKMCIRDRGYTLMYVLQDAHITALSQIIHIEVVYIFHLVAPLPVSYTHLDVYKRQVLEPVVAAAFLEHPVKTAIARTAARHRPTSPFHLFPRTLYILLLSTVTLQMWIRDRPFI